jgi:large subunit ribosomal protein L25
MKQIKLSVNGRNETGRGPARRLRASGNVPAVLYGKHIEPVSLVLNSGELSRLLKETAGAAALVELVQEGKEPTLSVVQEVQRNPVTDQIVHIDFHEVSAQEEMETHVNIHLIGEAFGVKNQNGLVDFVTHQIDVRCLPKNLPSFVEVDVSGLKVGESIHVKELPKYEGVTYLADADHVIASCTEQRVDAAASVTAVAGAEAEAIAQSEKKAE